MSMTLLEAVKSRRSIRAYKKQELPQGTVEKLLEAATLAPSAGNVQPWAVCGCLLSGYEAGSELGSLRAGAG